MSDVIAIDYTAAYEQGAGIGRYVRELVAALARQDTEGRYRLFVSGARHQTLPPLPGENFIWKATRITPRWLVRLRHRLHLPVPIECFTGRVALYHATDFVLPPVLFNTPTLLTVHDLSFIRVPETASPPLKRYLDAVVPRSVQRATHVLAVSEATKNDLIDLYGTPPEKITVKYHGVDPHFRRIEDGLAEVRRKYHIPERPYIFAVGTVQPRKNYSRLIEALARLRSQGYGIDLVVAGGKGWLDNPIYRTIADSGMADYTHLIGFADDADLPALISGAVAMAYVSLYEGFGLPILEGMACGVPVVTSTDSSLPEVAGDAALLVDPYNVEGIADALRRVIEDNTLRETLIQRGYEQVKPFTWERAATQLLGLYRQMLNQS